MQPEKSPVRRSALANLKISEDVLNAPHKRRRFLKGLMVAGAAALTLEHLEKAFYDMAVATVPPSSGAHR